MAHTRFSITCLVALAVTVGGVTADQSPRDRMLATVPADVSFCLVVQDIRGRWATLDRSDFLERFTRTPLGASILDAPVLAEMGKFDEILRQQLGIGWDQFRDEVIGDAVVFAFREGDPGENEGEYLYGTWVRHQGGAEWLLGKLRAAVELEERRDGERRYFRAANPEGAVEYFANDGPVLLSSNSETFLIEALGDSSGTGVAARIEELGVSDRMFVWWLNPRGFRAEFDAVMKSVGERELAFLTRFREDWLALDGVAIHADVTDVFEFGVAVKYRPDDLSPTSARLFESLARRSRLWPAVPRDAIAAAASHVDFTLTLDLIRELLSEEERATFDRQLRGQLGPLVGRDPVARFFRGLGPDWGFWIDERSGLGATFAVRINDDLAGSLQTGLATLAGFATLGLNQNRSDSDPYRFRRLRVGESQLVFIEGGGLPEGVRPSFGIVNGWLLFASHPDRIKGFESPTGGTTPVAASLVGWVRLDRIADLLREHELYLGAEESRSVADTLAIFDGLEVHSDRSPGRFGFRLRVSSRFLGEPKK